MPTSNTPSKPEFVYSLPGMGRVRVRKDLPYKQTDDGPLQMDMYYPPDLGPNDHRPAVIFLHGDAPPEYLVGIKDGAQYTGWGQLTAASGLIAITANRRSTLRRTQLAASAQDVDDLLVYTRAHALELQVDPDRLGVWVCSAGPSVGLRTLLRDAPPFVHCLMIFYGQLDLRPLRAVTDSSVPDAVLAEYSPLVQLEQATQTLPPLLLVRAGQDDAQLNASIDQFLHVALQKNLPIEVINHPSGPHSFDVRENSQRSREIIARTIGFMQHHLSM